MRNLALIRLGRFDEMANFPRETKKANTELPINMVYHVFGRMLYYQYGLLNDCHRMCMEDGVEYGWNVELLKYMARCSMINGESQAARKSLNLLRHTGFYCKWADAREKYIDNPSLIVETREFGPVSHMQQYNNAVGGNAGNVENHIMSALSRQDSDDPYFMGVKTAYRNAYFFYYYFN